MMSLVVALMEVSICGDALFLSGLEEPSYIALYFKYKFQ
mgnify:CR=1 FL=1